MQYQEARRIEIHQALHRHSLVLGGERELVMLSALFAFLVGLGSLAFVSIVIVVIFWIVSLFALRKMAKFDPLLSKVFLLHIKQQSFYSAKSSRWRQMEGYKVKK